MTKVKICGVTSLKDLETVSCFGADAVGMITGISSSPRNLTTDAAQHLVRKTPVFTKSVLVMYPPSLKEAIKICEYVRPDAVQIHGDNISLKEFSDAVPGTGIIKALSVNNSDVINDALKAADSSDAVLLDSSTERKLGGTGKVHDWDVSREIVEAIKPKPVILAGGLNTDNVLEAINRVHPYALDVCTGTEVSPGVKDPGKVQRFLSIVKEADRRY